VDDLVPRADGHARGRGAAQGNAARNGAAESDAAVGGGSGGADADGQANGRPDTGTAMVNGTSGIPAGTAVTSGQQSADTRG